MYYNELKERLALRRDANFSALANVTAKRYEAALNEAHRAVLRMPGMEKLRQTTVTEPSVIGTQTYTITGCAKINRIWETTNDTKLEYRTLDWLRKMDPDPNSGTPCVWIPTTAGGREQSYLLWPTPSAAITYSLDILLSVTDMTEDSDEPLLPDDFHDLLIDKAELKETKKSDDPARYQMLIAEIARAEKDLRSWITAHPDWNPVMGGERTGYSRLGSWFPSGT